MNEPIQDSKLSEGVEVGALQVLGSRQHTLYEDVIQESYLKLLRRLDGSEGDIQSPFAYGLTVGKNVARTLLALENRYDEGQSTGEVGVDSEEEFSDTVSTLSDHGAEAAKTEQVTTLRALLGHVSPLDCWILERLCSEDWSQRQVAQTLGVSEAAISTRMSKLKKRIRRLVEQDFDPTDPGRRPPGGASARRKSLHSATYGPGGTLKRNGRRGKSSFLDIPIPVSSATQVLCLILELPCFDELGFAAEPSGVKNFADILARLGLGSWVEPARQLSAQRIQVEQVRCADEGPRIGLFQQIRTTSGGLEARRGLHHADLVQGLIAHFLGHGCAKVPSQVATKVFATLLADVDDNFSTVETRDNQVVRWSREALQAKHRAGDPYVGLLVILYLMNDPAAGADPEPEKAKKAQLVTQLIQDNAHEIELDGSGSHFDVFGLEGDEPVN